MTFLLLLLGGICFGLMVSLNGLLASYLNIFEISLFVHMIGAILLLVDLIAVKREKMKLSGAPVYVYFVGLLGVALVATSSLSTAHIGAAVTMSFAVTGQLVTSAVIDHFGWFHTPVSRFRFARAPAFCMILAGLLLMVVS
ncbi:DMT family transporter [Caproicibacter sp.]|uniref:DMT family transporter n=1 Tax=Caproicibacter sp. TaxID=2814884 RepID=UPI003989D66D